MSSVINVVHSESKSYCFCLSRKSTVAPALKALVKAILNKSGGKNWRWLPALPLYHFLVNRSAPFKALSPKEETQWNWRFWDELTRVGKLQR